MNLRRIRNLLEFRATRGIALALALVLMPVCMILMYMFVDSVLLSTRASMQERGRSQTFYMAEAGLAIAYDAFQANNFAGTTHDLGGTNVTQPPNCFVMPAVTPGNMTFTQETSGNYKGWWLWQWDPSQSKALAFSDGFEQESIRFRIYFTDSTHWRIDCLAKSGGWQNSHSMQGVIENNTQYALYSAGDLEDLSRVDNITVNGKIHANGNIYLLPKFLTSWSPPMKATFLCSLFQICGAVSWPIITTAVPTGSDLHVVWQNFQSDTLSNVNVTVTVNVTGQVEGAGKIIRSDDLHQEVAKGSGSESGSGSNSTLVWQTNASSAPSAPTPPVAGVPYLLYGGQWVMLPCPAGSVDGFLPPAEIPSFGEPPGPGNYTLYGPNLSASYPWQWVDTLPGPSGFNVSTVGCYNSAGQTGTSGIRFKKCMVFLNGVPIPWASAGQAIDSNNPTWSSQAPSIFNHTVIDGSLGAHTRNSFDPRALLPSSGYYYKRATTSGGAGLLLDDSAYNSGTFPPGVTKASFFNVAENRPVTLFDVNLQAINWPSSNLLIYSTKPIRLYNGQILPQDLTVVSPATIYTKGNFNIGSGGTHKAAALITMDRIYHLSDGWLDTTAQNYWDPSNPTSTSNAPFKIQNNVQDSASNIDKRNFPPHAAMNSGNTLTINADLVDGIPAIHELNWSGLSNFGDPDPNTSAYDADSVNFTRGHLTNGSYQKFWQASLDCAAASDGMLEEFCQLGCDMKDPTWDDIFNDFSSASNPDNAPFPSGNVGIIRCGSVMHLQCAHMAQPAIQPATWDQAPYVTPWLVRGYYTPWSREFDYDSTFTINPPSYAPNVSTKTLWSVGS